MFVHSNQALSLKETEKAALSERASTLQAELSSASLEVERLSREAGHAKEMERVRANAFISNTATLYRLTGSFSSHTL